MLAAAAVDKQLEQDLETTGAPGGDSQLPERDKGREGTTVTCPEAGAGGVVADVSFEFGDAVAAIDQTSVDTGNGAMIERLHDMPPGTVGFRMKGEVEREDYEEVLAPELRRALEAGGGLRTLSSCSTSVG